MRRFALLVAGLALLAGAGSGVSGGGRQTQTRWVVTDLGTLGGKSSDAVALNERGQIIGWSDTSRKDADGFAIRHVFLWEQGKMRDLGNIYPAAINELGQIIGQGETSSGENHAFLWQRGRITDLGTLGGKRSWANDINDRGQIVGGSTRTDGQSHAVLWRGLTRIVDLGTLDGSTSDATAVNNREQVVGWSKKPARGGPNAFLWERGKMRTIGKERSSALALNELGQIVGWSQITSFKDTRPVRWYRGKMAVLGSARERGGKAWAINENGLTLAEGVQGGRSFVWKSGARTDLGAFHPSSAASAVNDLDQVVGHTYLAGAPAALWQYGNLTRLPHLPGCNVSYAEAVNNRRQIVGWCENWSVNQSGNRHAALWTLKRG